MHGVPVRELGAAVPVEVVAAAESASMTTSSPTSSEWDFSSSSSTAASDDWSKSNEESLGSSSSDSESSNESTPCAADTIRGCMGSQSQYLYSGAQVSYLQSLMLLLHFLLIHGLRFR